MSKTILCHCEDVEIEELYSALEQGYGDVETLKRYTGIATGKCQGKCCLVQTIRLLAEIKEGKKSVRPGRQCVPFNDDYLRLKLPTIRQPVIPLRIEDIVGGDNQ